MAKKPATTEPIKLWTLLPDTDTHYHRMDVPSDTSDNVYRTSQRKTDQRWCCECPQGLRKNSIKDIKPEQYCKHVQWRLGLKTPKKKKFGTGYRQYAGVSTPAQPQPSTTEILDGVRKLD